MIAAGGIGNAHLRQQRQHLLAQGFTPHAAVSENRLLNLSSDAFQRVQVAERILRYIANLRAAQLTLLFRGKGVQRLVVKDNFSLHAHLRRLQAQHRQQAEAFPGPGFTHYRQRFTRFDVKTDAVDQRAVRVKANRQAAYIE
ncbi:Uncharacterised protein [Klebsiella variicola]|nr:Uncharacterised protein [Klebsiella variicola]